MDRNKLKNLYKKLFVSEVVLPLDVRKIHERVGTELVTDRTFFYGATRKKVRSLQMESAPGTAETVIEMLLRLQPSGKVLDFGCGQHQSRYLRNLGLDVHACDIFDFHTSNYIRLDAEKSVLPFADNEFEVVVASEVIEHVESPFQLLTELKRITSRHLIVTTPNPMSKKSRKTFYKTGYLYWFAPENFEYHISPVFLWQLQRFCKHHKLELQETKGNHEIFGLGGQGQLLDLAESMILLIKK